MLYVLKWATLVGVVSQVYRFSQEYSVGSKSAMSTLRAGLSRQTVFPPPGIYPMGYGNRLQGDTGIHDDLYVTTLVLEDGNTRAAIIHRRSYSYPFDDRRADQSVPPRYTA